MTTERRKLDAYITTRSGILFDYREPRPEMFRLEDVAFALSRIPRFGGHVANYTVAHHSLLVERLAKQHGEDPEVRLAALMHDAHEAYVGDVPTPLKVLCPDHNVIEDRVERILRETMTPSLRSEHYETVRQYDQFAMHLEAFVLFDTPPVWVDVTLAWRLIRTGVACAPLGDPAAAERLLIEAARELGAIDGPDAG